jgi:CSLREA domain-containing protein
VSLRDPKEFAMTLFTTSLRRITTAVLPRPGGRRRSPRRPVLEIERLEGRVVLSTYTVTTLADASPPNGTLSLREAIILANADNASGSQNKPTAQNPDIIQFAVTGAIDTASALPSLTSNIVIEGPGASSLTIGHATTAVYPTLDVAGHATGVQISGVTLEGGPGSPALQVEVGASASLIDSVASGSYGSSQTASDIDLDGGSLSVVGSTVTDALNPYTAGIFVTGTGGGSLSVSQSTISDNKGGGIFMAPVPLTNNTVANPNTLVVSDSTVSGNTADPVDGGGSGGGLFLGDGTIATVVDSTIADNVASGGGGGVYYDGRVSSLTIDGSTIAGNDSGLDQPGGGIYEEATAVPAVLRDTIVATNVHATAESNNGTPTATTPDDISGALDTSGAFDLIGDGAGMTGLYTGVNGNVIGTAALSVNPQLGPLQNNGGPTDTMALLGGSPAIDRGDADSALGATDQRGLARVNVLPSIPAPAGGDGSDIGAYEVQGSPAPTVLVVNSTADTNQPAGTLTLREAIEAVDGSVPLSRLPAGQVTVGTTYEYVIQLEVTGTIDTASPLPAIDGNVSIQGPGASSLTIQSAATGSPILVVAPYANIVAISGVTLEGGASSPGLQVEVGASASLTDSVASGSYGDSQTDSDIVIDGGSLSVVGSTVTDALGPRDAGIYVSGAGGGSLTVSQSTISGNKGGGIFMGFVPLNNADIVPNPNTLVISDSTVSGNTANPVDGGGSGGGVFLGDGTIATILDSTIGGNVAGGEGGGVYYDGSQSSLTIDGSTIAGNESGLDQPGGGIYEQPTAKVAAVLRDTIVATNVHETAVNSNGNPTATTPDDISGALEATSFNVLIGVGTDMSGLTNGVNGNLVGTAAQPINPRLGPLQNNGGPTDTMVLLPGSPALNAGSGRAATGRPDQRGVSRSTITNIGAYQATASEIVVLYPSPTTAGVAQTFVAEVVDADSQIAYGYTGQVTFSSSDPDAVLPPPSMLYDGFGSFTGTLETAGSQTITASSGGLTGQQSGIVVQAAAASALEIQEGNGQTAIVATSYADPLEALVVDAYGNPVAGVSVTFTVQANNGAGASFAGSSTVTVTTGVYGLATAPTLTANGTADSFTVGVSVGTKRGLSGSFSLANTAAPRLEISSTPANKALQGDTTGTITLATFTDPDLGMFPLTQYTATINWGDGTTSAGTVTIVNDALAVSGSHTFSTSGSFRVSVTLADQPTGRSITATDPITVAPDLAGQFQATESGLRLNHATGLYSGTLTFTNTGGSLLSGTIELVLAGLPSSVTLANASGVTGSGLPYLLIPLGKPLLPGQSITISLQFRNTSNLLFDYAIRAYDFA